MRLKTHLPWGPLALMLSACMRSVPTRFVKARPTCKDCQRLLRGTGRTAADATGKP